MRRERGGEGEGEGEKGEKVGGGGGGGGGGRKERERGEKGKAVEEGCTVIPLDACRIGQELIVSIPLRLGKKVIAHHTLLTCTGQATPTEKPQPVSHSEGEVIWAQAPSLPAWPGRILAAEGKVPVNKVGVIMKMSSFETSPHAGNVVVQKSRGESTHAFNSKYPPKVRACADSLDNQPKNSYLMVCLHYEAAQNSI